MISFCLPDTWQPWAANADSLLYLLVYRNIGVPLQLLVSTTFPTLKLQPLPNSSPTSIATGHILSFWQAHKNWQKAMLKNASVGSFPPPFFPPSPHSLTLSAQAGAGRTEMAFWVTQAGYAICRVNWWKRIEKEVETNDDGLAMIVSRPLLAFTRHLFTPGSLKSK